MLTSSIVNLSAYDVQKAYFLCDFPRKVVWTLEYLSAYIESDVHIVA